MYLQIGISKISLLTRLVAEYIAITTEFPEMNALLPRLIVYDYIVSVIAIFIQIKPPPKNAPCLLSENTII